MLLPSYPDLSPLAGTYPGPQIFLGRNLYWTEKRDGSNLRLALADDGSLLVATRHMERAADSFITHLRESGRLSLLIEMMIDYGPNSDAPDVAAFDIRPVVFGEMLVRGKSPARFEMHDKDEFVVFDIWDTHKEAFLPWPLVYQMCYHYGLPVVECWGHSRHTTLESLYAFRDDMLVVAKERGREGVVVKAFGGPTRETVYAKEKLDTPRIERVQIEPGRPELPPLAESEVMGVVAKVHADLGEDIRDASKAMPLVAQYVAEEQKKHQAGKPQVRLFDAYKAYLEGVNM